MDEQKVLADMLDKLVFDPQAKMSFELFAGGLYWSDEWPKWNYDGSKPGESPPGLGMFRALLNYRSSLILGQPNECFQEVWESLLQLCPNWPGFLPSRRVPALANECKRLGAAGLRSWEDADEKFEKQRRDAKKKVIA